MGQVTDKFANAVASSIGVDNSDGWFTSFLTEWARWEGANSKFNPLATTQRMPGAGDFNSAGVKNYTSFEQGVQATAKTLTNKYYPDLMKALRTRDFSDIRGITANIKTWGTIGFANVIGTGEYVPDGSGPVQGRAATTPATGGPEVGISPRLEPGEGGEVGDLLEDIEGNDWQAYADQLLETAGVMMGSQPKVEDFQDDDNGTALENWNFAYSGFLDTLARTQQLAQSFQQMQGGMIQLNDGTLMPMGDMEPDKLQGLIDSNTNNYATLRNEFSVGQYNLDTGYKQNQYRGELDEIAAKNTLDETGLTASAQAIDRVLMGLQESRNRSGFVTDTLSANAGMMTGPLGQGKTSFSAEDFGGIGTYISDIMGFGDNPFLNLTGSVGIDPQGLLNQYDRELGIQGGIPGPYVPSQTPDDVPSAPQFDRPPNLIPPIDSGANITQPPPGSTQPEVTNQGSPAAGVAPPNEFDPFSAYGPFATPAPSSFFDVFQGLTSPDNGDGGGGFWGNFDPRNIPFGKLDPRNIPFSWSAPSNYIPGP